MTGWLKETLKFKDWILGSLKPTKEDFEWDSTGLPIIFQGQENTCVSCSVTFIQQWFEKNALSHEWLAKISGTKPEGVEPSKVLEAARKIGICLEETYEKRPEMGYLDAQNHRIPAYAYIPNRSKENIAGHIEKNPIMVGVDDFNGKGPHMLAATGFNLRENVVKCANWWRLDRQDFVTIPFNQITFACAILPNKPLAKPTMQILEVIKDKLASLPKKWLAIGGGVLVIVIALLSGGEKMFGAGYTPVTGYQSRTTSYINGSASIIPVASTKDKAGNQISLSGISPSSTVRVYLNVEAGTSREEIVACTGVTVSSWTGCTRGLSFQGGSLTASSTLQKAHNAGSAVMITNVGQFYSEYVSVDGTQNVYGVKTFYNYPTMNSNTSIPSVGGQLATKYYVDTVGAGGFTAVNVSTTRGLSVDGSSPEKVGVKLTSNYGLRFLGNGSLVISTTTALTWSGAQTFASIAGATTTADALHYSGFATKNYSLMNRQSTDMRILQGSATGTVKLAAGVTAGRALWVGSTSTLAMTNTSAASSTFGFVGIALETKTIGQTVRYARPGEVACGLSGLIPGMDYFLNGTAGEISLTDAASYKARVGKALTSSCLLVAKPKYKIVIKPTIATCNGAADYTLTTAFRPVSARIEGANYAGSWSDVGQQVIFGTTWLDGRVYKVDCGSGTYTDWTASVTNNTFKLTKTNTGSPAGGLNATPYITVEGE